MVGDSVTPATQAGDAIDPLAEWSAKRVEEELIAGRCTERAGDEHAPITEGSGGNCDARDHKHRFAFDHGCHEHSGIGEHVGAEHLYLTRGVRLQAD